MDTVKKGTVIQSLQIGLVIVDFVAKQTQPVSFTTILDNTGITKSNLYKYLNTLTQLGLLYRDREHGGYSLGSKLVEYGMVAVNHENVLDRSNSFLQEINNYCQNTVLLAVWTNRGPIVVKMINDNIGFNIGAQIGTYLPLFSAIGKIFAVFMDPLETKEWMEQELTSVSAENKTKLEQECNQVKNHLISFATESMASSVSSVALPIFNYKKRLLGAFALVGFTESIPHNIKDEYSQYLLQMSKQISEAFGYQG